jgi:hypothetical protein
MIEAPTTLRSRDAIRAGHKARADAMEAALNRILPWRRGR